MLKQTSLLLGITSFITSLYGGDFNSLIADNLGQSQVTLVITTDPTTTLTGGDLATPIVISNAQELNEGFISHSTNISARSPHPSGYYVEVQTTDSRYLSTRSGVGEAPSTCFCMVRDHDPFYGIDFDLLADKSPQGHPTPIHHEGFGPPQGGTPHLNKSKIINTEGQPNINLQVYGIHFFIFAKQFKQVPHGYYISRLVINLIET